MTTTVVAVHMVLWPTSYSLRMDSPNFDWCCNFYISAQYHFVYHTWCSCGEREDTMEALKHLLSCQVLSKCMTVGLSLLFP